jgi:hypothetical protein
MSKLKQERSDGGDAFIPESRKFPVRRMGWPS